MSEPFSIIKIRPETRQKYEKVREIKRLKFVEVADLAIDSLLKADPELKRKYKREPVAS